MRAKEYRSQVCCCMKNLSFIMQYIPDILQCIVYNENEIGDPVHMHWHVVQEGGGIFRMKNKRMKIARIAHDMNQEELAKRVGVTRQTIGMIEQWNYNPTLKLCMAICDALDCTLDTLFWIPKEERSQEDETR